MSSARPRSARVRARWSPASGSKRTGVGAVCRPGPGAVMRSPPNSAHASTAAGKTVCRWPPGETWARRESAQCSASLMSRRPGCQPASRRAASTATGNLVVLRWSVIVAVSAVLGCGRGDGAYPEVVEHRRTGSAGWCVAAVEGVAVLADAACGQFRLFERASRFALGEGFRWARLERCASAAVRWREQDRLGAAAGEPFALSAGEGVEEILDERVEDGRLVRLACGAREGLAAYGECRRDGGQDSVPAVTQCGWLVCFGGAPTEAWITRSAWLRCVHGAFVPSLHPRVAGQPAKCDAWYGSWGAQACRGFGGGSLEGDGW